MLRIASDGSADHNGTQIEIGGNERYINLCRKHWAKEQGEAERKDAAE